MSKLRTVGGPRGGRVLHLVRKLLGDAIGYKVKLIRPSLTRFNFAYCN